MEWNLLHTVPLGDMAARYVLERESGQLELRLLPSDLEAPAEPARQRREPQGLIQAHLAGDVSPRGYGNGVTLNQNGTVGALQLLEQRRTDHHISTVLAHPSGCRFTHHLRWDGRSPVVECWAEAENLGEETVLLEQLASFSLGGLPPLQTGPGGLKLHRLRSAWSMEGRLATETLEQLNLEPSWARHGVRRERFGQVGSMPVNQWFPWLVLEDREHGLFWGCRLACPGSWQMEVLRQDDAVSLTGGLADYLYGHWRKRLYPGRAFETPHAYLTVCRGETADDAARRMVKAMEGCIPAGPLPLFFNEYCATWGNPSERSVAEQLACLQGRGFTHFVIDAGWYRPEDGGWDDAPGDYRLSRELFPDGIEGTVAAIRAAGMVPGIWFESETAGPTADAYQETAHLLKRDGYVVTTPTRRFWDLRDPWVRDYLRERVIGFLRDKGFGYVKADYNETIGLGCDGAESPGEGLRQQLEAVQDFYQELRSAVPGIQMELCASGGHRLEPGFLELFDFASFSDAHECAAIPIVAANLHRVMQPGQMQVWAVLRKEDTAVRIGYSLCAAMLGAMCISGDVTALTPEQWQAVDAGLRFYRRASEAIRSGTSYRYGPEVLSYNSPAGWQAVVRRGENGETLAVLHRFAGEEQEEIAVPVGAAKILAVYDCCGSEISLEDRMLHWRPAVPMSAVAVLLGS